MIIELSGVTESLLPGISEIAKDTGIILKSGGKKVSVSVIEKGFSVNATNEFASIEYHTEADFFRGFSILADALKNGYDVSLKQEPAFETCGIMLDVSRGAVLKIDTVKDIMRRIARMGFNELMLYTEDTYELKEYPYFGYMRGRYTEEELKEIVAYGNMLGIETVPCIQTLGHLMHPLRWSAFGSMVDQPAVLLIDEEKTYTFIESMIKTVRRCFTSSKIHIGMDESHGVGLGTYLQKHGYRNRFQILTRHLDRVLSICKQYNFEPMMWSDMFFRLGTKNGEYYSADAALPDNIAELIPGGVSQVYWDYYNNSENLYNVMIREHKKMDTPVIFAGGVWIWSGPSVNNRQTIESTLPSLKVCKEQGITHILATLWGDDGCECDVYQALYGLQLYAEYNYTDGYSQENLDRMFEICNGFSADAFRLLDIDDFGQPVYCPDKPIFGEFESHIVNTSKQVLYQNPLYGLFDANFRDVDLYSHYKDILGKLDKVDFPKELETLFESHKQLVKVLMLKCDIGLRLKDAYDSKDNSALSSLSEELKGLICEIAVLRDLRIKLWFENNKPFGHEQILSRLASTEAFIKLAYERITAYLNGETNTLEEFEAERLPYNGMDRPYFIEYSSRRIQMPIA